MAHFKRKRPKSRRSGCQMCKPWKSNAFKDQVQSLTPRDRREKDRMDAQEKELREGS